MIDTPLSGRDFARIGDGDALFSGRQRFGDFNLVFQHRGIGIGCVFAAGCAVSQPLPENGTRRFTVQNQRPGAQ